MGCFLRLTVCVGLFLAFDSLWWSVSLVVYSGLCFAFDNLSVMVCFLPITVCLWWSVSCLWQSVMVYFFPLIGCLWWRFLPLTVCLRPSRFQRCRSEMGSTEGSDMFLNKRYRSSSLRKSRSTSPIKLSMQFRADSGESFSYSRSIIRNIVKYYALSFVFCCFSFSSFHPTSWINLNIFSII